MNDATLSLAEKRLAKAAPATLIEQVLIKGDLKNLTPEERNAYYLKVCESAGLNPLMKPLEYITLNGKLVLYALRSCTDQLRSIHGVSVVDMDNETHDGVHIVTVKVVDRNGRTDMARGAVSLGNLKGEALANALMKAETKAKRRATLSICGLGLLDETEIETIPGAVREPEREPDQPQKVLNPDTGRMVDPNSSHQLRKSGAWDSFTDHVQGFTDAADSEGLRAWFTSEAVAAKIAAWSPGFRDAAEEHFAEAMDRMGKA